MPGMPAASGTKGLSTTARHRTWPSRAAQMRCTPRRETRIGSPAGSTAKASLEPSVGTPLHQERARPIAGERTAIGGGDEGDTPESMEGPSLPWDGSIPQDLAVQGMSAHPLSVPGQALAR